MNLRQIIAHDYAEYVGLYAHLYPRELINGLKAKERFPQFLEKMSQELTAAEKHRRVRLDRMKIKNAVYEMTKFFLNNLKRHADEMIMSENEKQLLIKRDKASKSISDEEALELEKELVADKIVITDERTKSV